MKKDRQRIATAYHEAGHAIAALVLESQEPPTSATIVPTDDSLGSVSSTVPESFDPEEMRPEDVIYLEESIIALMCGMAAERKHAGRRNWNGASADYRAAVNLALHRFNQMEGCPVNAYVRFWQARADALIDRQWRAVKGVAAALLEKGELDIRQIRAAAFPPPPTT